MRRWWRIAGQRRVVFCLLLLQLLLLSSRDVRPVESSSGDWAMYGLGAVPPYSTYYPRPALAQLNNTAYERWQCSITFDHIERVYSRWPAGYHAPRVNAFVCPQHCLDLLGTDNSTVAEDADWTRRVHGSFPYHNKSSACLAAIHSGVIRNEDGGGVFLGRFYPQDWSGTDTQTLFPYSSSQPSFSNGVQSLAVPGAWHAVPSALDSYSWTVRSRGVIGLQRQTAPFTPRSGHVHAVLYPLLMWYTGWHLFKSPMVDRVYFPLGLVYSRLNLHIITGGRNDTHYMNDVWLYHQHTYPYFVNYLSSTNGQFYRLPDAPFSPRSNLRFHLILDPPPPILQYPTANATHTVALVVVGGETGYACGNRLFGQCSAEVWQLNLTRGRTADSNYGSYVADLDMSFQWWSPSGNNSEPYGRMPFAPRCDFAAVVDRRLITPRQSRIIGVVGGQLSFNHSGNDTCATPLNTTSEAWYAQWPHLSRWSRGVDAPFAPRRGMAVEDAVLNVDSRYYNNQRVLRPQLYFVQPEVPAPLDKTVSLAGGIHYLHHRIDPQQPDIAIITQARLYADVWSCVLSTPEWSEPHQPVDCDWHYSYPQARLGRNDSAAPSASLPVPVAHGASALYPAGSDFINMRLGGVTSRAAHRQLLATRTTRVRDGFGSVRWSRVANVSVFFQPEVIATQRNPSLADVMWSRYQLPLSFDVDEDELNDVNSSFSLGSELMVTHTLPVSQCNFKPLLTSVHSQKSQMVLSPEESTDVLPQAAPSHNSTRGQFDWPTARLGHALASTWDTAIISGGSASGLHSNDWIVYVTASCFWPDDVSYRRALGAIKLYSRNAQYEWNEWVYYPERREDAVPVFHSGAVFELSCQPGHHWEPPIDDDAVRFTCAANGLWVDSQLGIVRRCEPDALQCPYPLVDAGYTVCMDPLPQVTAVRVVAADWREVEVQPHNLDSARVVDLPFNREEFTRTLQLVVEGQWLSPPIVVNVGYPACVDPQLRNISRYCVDPEQPSSCREYGTSIACSLSSEADKELPVTIGVGRRRFPLVQIRSLKPQLGGGPSVEGSKLSVAWRPPRIVSLASAYCKHPVAGNPRVMDDCPTNVSFPITLCLTDLSTGRSNTQPWVFVDDNQRLVCPSLVYGIVDRHTCLPGNDDLQCGTFHTCLTCYVPLGWTQQLAFRVERSNMGQDNSLQLSNVTDAAVIRFRQCAAGSQPVMRNATRWRSGVWENFTYKTCELCPPGTATTAGLDQECVACNLGHFAAFNGSAQCKPCIAGSHAPSVQMSSCLPCEGNSWQPASGQSRCLQCGQGKYKVRPEADANASTTCESCPDGVDCVTIDTALIASAGRYGVVDQHSGTVSTVDCSLTACVGLASGYNGSAALNTSYTVAGSGLSLLNICGAGRRPAVGDGGYLNVLCAECEDGYSEVQGQCVPCDGVRWGLLLGCLLLCFAAVYCLHWLSQESSGSATLSIMAYHVQMSALFLSSEPLPIVQQLLTLLSVDLMDNSAAPWMGPAASNVQPWCVAPLSDGAKIITRVLSPLVALALLAMLLAMQLLWRGALRHGQRRSDGMARACCARTYSKLLSFSAVGEDDPGHRHSNDSDAPRPAAVVLSALKGEDSLDAPLLHEAPADQPVSAMHEVAVAESGDRAAAAETVRSILLRYQRTTVCLALFSYNAVTLVCLSFFYDRQVGGLGRRLWFYPATDVSSDTYAALIPVMVTLLVGSVLGGPVLVYCYLLWLQLRKRAALSNADAVVAPEPAADALNGMFKPRYWYWTVVVLLRRLLLLLIFTLCTSSVYSWLTVACQAVLFLHVLAWPYRFDRDSWLEALTLAALSTQTAVLTAFPDPRLRPNTARAIVWLLLVVPVLVALCLRFSQQSMGKCRKWQQRPADEADSHSLL